MSKTLTFKNTLYNIIDSGDIGNEWKYVEVIDKKQAFSLPKCLYYKGKSMKNLLSYTDYVNHLDMGKDFINDFVKEVTFVATHFVLCLATKTHDATSDWIYPKSETLT